MPSSDSHLAGNLADHPSVPCGLRPGPDPSALKAELTRLRDWLPEPISLAEFQRQQAEHDARCEALFARHFDQMRAARLEQARQDPWFERLVQAALWRLSRTHIERVVWNRASLALHHWAWLAHKRPSLSAQARATLSARRALRRSPERAQRVFEAPLAEALLHVVQPQG